MADTECRIIPGATLGREGIYDTHLHIASPAAGLGMGCDLDVLTGAYFNLRKPAAAKV